MIMKRLHRIIIFGSLLILLSSFSGDIPGLINFQCMLKEKNGEPLPEGGYTITFRIYTNNVEVWNEKHEEVFIGGGMLNILLGSVNPVTWDFSGPAELGIQFEGELELTPRVPLTANAYSFTSIYSDSIAGYDISPKPKPESLLPLDSVGKFPEAVIPGSIHPDFIKKNVPDTSSGKTTGSLLYVKNLGNGTGVFVESQNSNAIVAKTSSTNQAAIEGENTENRSGVRGVSTQHHGIIGYGEHAGKAGVYGNNPNGKGVWGMSSKGNGVHGQSTHSHGVVGKNAPSDSSIAAIYADRKTGVAIKGKSNKRDGVMGWTNNPQKSGVFGVSNEGTGVSGRAEGNQSEDGVFGVSESQNDKFAGVHARNEGQSDGPAIYCEGDLYVTGAITGMKGNNKGIFIPPAFDSGWLTVNKGGEIEITHNLGGSPGNYFVDMWFKSSTFGIHHYKIGGDYHRVREAPLYSDRKAFGAFWYALNDHSVHVYREEDDPLVEQVRIRIWVSK